MFFHLYKLVPPVPRRSLVTHIKKTWDSTFYLLIEVFDYLQPNKRVKPTFPQALTLLLVAFEIVEVSISKNRS